MKFFVVALFVACASAVSLEQDAKVLRQEYEQSPEGNYQAAFETENGIQSQAVGKFEVYGKDEGAVIVQGANSYKSPEGQVYSLTYTADKDGYHPVGDFLPTPPPPQAIPEYIIRSLEYIAAHPYVEKKN